VVSFTPLPIYPATHWIGGWVGPRPDLDGVKKRKFLHPSVVELRPFGRPACSQSLYRLYYPGSVCLCIPHNFYAVRLVSKESRRLILPRTTPRVAGFEFVCRWSRLSSASTWFLAWLILQPWRLGRHVLSKRRLIFNGLFGVKFYNLLLRHSSDNFHSRLQIKLLCAFLCSRARATWRVYIYIYIYTNYGVQRPRSEADHSPPRSTEDRNAWSHTSFRDSVTFSPSFLFHFRRLFNDTFSIKNLNTLLIEKLWVINYKGFERKRSWLIRDNILIFAYSDRGKVLKPFWFVWETEKTCKSIMTWYVSVRHGSYPRTWATLSSLGVRGRIVVYFIVVDKSSGVFVMWLTEKCVI
jgi:hypothetical protein